VLFVAAQPLDEVATGWERQEVLIRDRLKLFDTGAQIDVVRTPTRKALTEALDGDVPYDVVHFVGHGKDGKLALVTDKNETDTISANDFTLLLSDRGIRMAVLSACRSAAGAFDRDFAVVAPSVVQGGVPAVLAMQYSVPALTAAEFVGLFYKQLLAKKQTLDGALAEARKHLAIQLGTDAVEWGVPVLYRGLAAANPFA
jgi:CHAT domain-containing protein